MTAIKKLIDGSGNQYFPQTHTKAVVDDNGYSVESRMQAVQDVVNQAQMAIGAVPNDLYPIAESTNWVTSGGVFNATVFPQDIYGAYVNYGYYMSASNTYLGHSTYKGFFMPVTDGEVYSVTGVNGNAAVFAVVTNKNISNGMAIPFATGYEQRLITEADGSMQITIPSDGKYMFVATVLGSGDVRPVIKRLHGVASIADSLTYDYVVSSEDGIKLSRYITSVNTWDATTEGRGSIVYPIDNIEKVDITANENYGTNYLFLTSYADDAIHWCECMEIRPTLTAGSSISLSIPADAKYFYIYTGDSGANFPSRLVFKKTLRSYEGQISEIGTKVDSVYSSLGDETFGDWTAFALDSGTSYSNLFIGGTWGNGKWNPITGKTIRVAAIPTGSKFVKVVCGSNAATIFLLQSTKAPVSNQNAETSVGYPDRILINANTATVIPLLPDCKAIAWSTTAINAPQSISFATTPTSLADVSKEWQTECIVANSCDTAEFNDTPIQCISTDDANATQYDNKVIGNVCVVKISESMYYMYYVCCGQNEQSGDQYLHLAMAYSTDGFTWTRGIPNGIEPPIAGTNLLINTGCIGECVVKVQDAEYPFRMIGGNWHQSTSLYKSADGVHWEVVRTWPYYFDNQASIIVRGNMMKIYMRMRNGTDREDRYLGVAYMDIWGNLLAPPTIYFGKYLYLAGASAIDDHREILFPTYFNASDSKAWLTCYIVDGTKVYPKEVDFTTILPDDGNWREVCPNMVNIGSEWYVYFGYCNDLHDSMTSSTVRTYKCAKVTWNRVGYWWYPQS